jgi:hypothetical protein
VLMTGLSISNDTELCLTVSRSVMLEHHTVQRAVSTKRSREAVCCLPVANATLTTLTKLLI